MKNLEKYLTLLSGEVDGLLLTSRYSRHYGAEFDIAEGVAIVSKAGCRYFTDSRYIESAEHGIQGFEVLCVDKFGYVKRINDAFADYSIRKAVSAGDVLGTIEVIGGVKKKVRLVATEDFSYAMRPDETCEFLVPGTGFVYAPVAADGNAGFVYVTIGGKAVGKVSVAYAVTIEQEEMPRKSFLKRLFGG